MTQISLTHLQAMKQRGEKIAMVTAYDACFAQVQAQAGVEVVLVGDSLGMVLQGKDSTVPVTIEHMIYHTQCVKQGAGSALIMADMPFMGAATVEKCLFHCQQLMQAGAHLIKLEGGIWLVEMIQQLARNGVPICAHLGLTPQSVNVFGGYKVQGRGEVQAQTLLATAQQLEQAGAALLLVECIPAELAQQLTQRSKIPVIGIGAGPHCDGQVLVMHDLLGITPGKPARFVKNFMQGAESIPSAFQHYVKAVKEGSFPAAEHGFE